MRRTFAVLLLLAAVSSYAQSAFERDVDRLANATLTTWHLPGLAIAVVQNDHVLLVKGYGVKELGKNDPVTADTIFQIGSTTKAFTTAAMAMLVDEKKLDWDDSPHKYLPYFHLSDACADSLVTLRDMVSHRTGAARHDELWDNTPLSREEIIRREGMMKPWKPIRSGYQYNNIMFVAAGEVVAAAAKMPWDDFVRTRIFEPLGMTHTRTRFADWAGSDHATSYAWSHGAAKLQPFNDYDNLSPAGTIASSARDMAQWLRFQLGNGTIDGKKLVSADALNETKTPQFPLKVDKELNPLSNVQSYAMGWNVVDYRGELLVAHAGALNGFRAQAALLPNRNAGVFVITNIGRGYALPALRNAILDKLLNAPEYDWNAAYVAVDAKGEAKAEEHRKEHEAKRHDENKPTHDFAAYAGTYRNAGYGDTTIAVENGRLVFRWMRLAIPLAHFNFDTFDATSEADDIDEPLQFSLAPDGAVRAFTMFGEEFVKQQ